MDQHHEEHILVVKTSLLFPSGSWQGMLSVDFNHYAQLIGTHKEFHPRSTMEQNPNYKQIIPYLIFTHNNNYFLMQRKAQASESRLKNKFSLGIGGHIVAEDLEHDDIAHWAQREFTEEVSYNGTYTLKPLGIINDDSTAVGKVHVGFVYLLVGNSPTIAIKSEHKQGNLISFEECISYYDSMEEWSKIVVDHLTKKTLAK